MSIGKRGVYGLLVLTASVLLAAGCSLLGLDGGSDGDPLVKDSVSINQQVEVYDVKNETTSTWDNPHDFVIEFDEYLYEEGLAIDKDGDGKATLELTEPDTSDLKTVRDHFNDDPNATPNLDVSNEDAKVKRLTITLLEEVNGDMKRLYRLSNIELIGHSDDYDPYAGTGKVYRKRYVYADRAVTISGKSDGDPDFFSYDLDLEKGYNIVTGTWDLENQTWTLESKEPPVEVDLRYYQNDPLDLKGSWSVIGTSSESGYDLSAWQSYNYEIGTEILSWNDSDNSYSGKATVFDYNNNDNYAIIYHFDHQESDSTYQLYTWTDVSGGETTLSVFEEVNDVNNVESTKMGTLTIQKQ